MKHLSRFNESSRDDLFDQLCNAESECEKLRELARIESIKMDEISDKYLRPLLEEVIDSDNIDSINELIKFLSDNKIHTKLSTFLFMKKYKIEHNELEINPKYVDTDFGTILTPDIIMEISEQNRKAKEAFNLHGECQSKMNVLSKNFYNW
jgi:hypothetical protein